ncbi:polyprenyl synthetase family protein [uncultured Campylobacter sp.]|uniref:polyprenyl synthetase family protein n=1 Tax=uncultured Campylobacter sp. TaxID=218934 RepID=UPI00260F0E35|nr:polyprenyl synthetase family protein [uncultured Campylobacter sp.]
MQDQIDLIMKSFIADCGYEPASEMFDRLSPGKKLRSKLLLNIAQKDEKSLRLCAIIELIQAASLLHDDVIDESSVRRGKPSINATYGSKNAVMLGDILYSKAYFELSKFESRIAAALSGAVTKLAVGELMDVSLSNDFNDDASKYLQMIYLKTSALIEEVARCGAFLKFGGAENHGEISDMSCAKNEGEIPSAAKDHDKISSASVKFGEYGKNLGLAFQIIDDILDVTQSSEALGKPSLSDFAEGKTTLPYIYLYENLDDAQRQKLKSFFKKQLCQSEISWIKAKLSEHGVIERCINEARAYGQKALEAVAEFKNDKLEQIVRDMIDREF